MKNNDSDGIIGLKGLKIKFVVSIRVPIDIGHIDANGILRRDNRFYYFQSAEVQMQEVENSWYSISIKDANDLKNIVEITVEEAACVLGRLKEILQENIATNQWNDEKAPIKSSKYHIDKERFEKVISEICKQVPFSQFYEIFMQMKAHEIYEMCQSNNPVSYLGNV